MTEQAALTTTIGAPSSKVSGNYLITEGESK